MLEPASGDEGSEQLTAKREGFRRTRKAHRAPNYSRERCTYVGYRSRTPNVSHLCDMLATSCLDRLMKRREDPRFSNFRANPVPVEIRA